MTADRNAFGVISAESRVISVHTPETFHESLTGQPGALADPVIDVGDRTEVDR